MRRRATANTAANTSNSTAEAAKRERERAEGLARLQWSQAVSREDAKAATDWMNLIKNGTTEQILAEVVRAAKQVDGKQENDAPSAENVDHKDGGSVDEPVCWICYEGGQELVAPCNCRGSMKWIHQKCLKKWLSASTAALRERLCCPNCRAPYSLVNSNSGNSRAHEVWVRNGILPDFKLLKQTLGESVSEDIRWRLFSCLLSAVPTIGLLIATAALMIDYRDQVHRYGEGPLLSSTSIGSMGFNALITQAFGNAFELPEGVEHGVHATWSRTYQYFQQFSFYCTAASLLLTLMGVHEWVSWGRYTGNWEAIARVVSLNPPLVMQMRNFFVCFVLVLMRPHQPLHEFFWWLCYTILSSWVLVILQTAQTLFVLVAWVALAVNEWQQLKSHVQVMWQLHTLGVDVAGGEDSASEEPED